MTQTLQEIAKLYAIGSISEEDVTFLLQKSNEPYHSFEELPAEFHKLVDDYNDYLVAAAENELGVSFSQNNMTIIAQTSETTVTEIVDKVVIVNGVLYGYCDEYLPIAVELQNTAITITD